METAVCRNIKARIARGRTVTQGAKAADTSKATDKHHNSGWNFISKYFPRRHFAFTALTLICQKSKHKFIGMQQLYSELLNWSRSAKLSFKYRVRNAARQCPRGSSYGES
ncbi:hypothetical protein F2981_10955 [Sinorhizobium meliloti]|nr:hypothetical protein [Sinorhizobium meliloti]